MKLYEIVFSGQLVPGAQPDLVKANMVKLFQADAQRIALLFSGRRLVLKNNLDEAAAEKYRSTLERAGAMAQVVPMAPVVQAPVVAAPGLVEVEEVELAPPPDEPSWTRKPSNLTAPRNDATPTRKASVKPRDVYVAAFVEVEGKRFFRTGDLGRVDADGFFYLTDRLKRMINASGFKVWPAEVEALMFRHPAVQEACVISTRDSYRGESVKAVVVLRASHKGLVTEAELIAWCRENMAVYKAPAQVAFVDALPKSGAGKVMWRTLQETENAA